VRREFWFWRHRRCRVLEARYASRPSSWHCTHHAAYWSDYEGAGYGTVAPALGVVALFATLVAVWIWDVFANHWWGL
jgi:hypothetical protein